MQISCERIDALQCNSLYCLNGDCDLTKGAINNGSIVYENDSEFGPLQVIESSIAAASNVVLPSKKSTIVFFGNAWFLWSAGA